MLQPIVTKEESQYQYPEAMQVYGIVVDTRLASALIKLGLDALSGKKVDLIVFLCVSTYDIRTRTDWNDIVSHIPVSGGKRVEYEVRDVQSPEEILYASLNMRIVRLPVDAVVI